MPGDDAGRRLKPVDAARYLGVDPAWLYRRRAGGGGPRFFKIGRVIRYDIADLDAWLEANKRDRNKPEKAERVSDV